VIFDSVTIAYAFLGVSRFGKPSSRALEISEDIWVPDLFFSEYANILWKSIQAKKINVEEGLGIIEDTLPLLTRVFPANEIMGTCLELAAGRDHTAYDGMYAALASMTGGKVLTFDRTFLKKFPEYTLHVLDYLAERDG